jgi:hypothetical protein
MAAFSTNGHRYSSYPNFLQTDLRVSKIYLRTVNSFGNQSLVHFGGIFDNIIFKNLKNKSINNVCS